MAEPRRGRRDFGKDRDKQGRGGNDRRPRDAGRDRAETEFISAIELRIREFMESSESELEFEPMNSFKRRKIHTIAKPFQLGTGSRGEEPDRKVVLTKSDESKIPAESLTESDESRIPAESLTESDESKRPAESVSKRPTETEPKPAERPASSERKPNTRIDFGNQTFPVIPGPDGIHIALKVDGSVEIFKESDRNMMVDDRLVTTREFKIRQSKIVLPGDAGW